MEGNANNAILQWNTTQIPIQSLSYCVYWREFWTICKCKSAQDWKGLSEEKVLIKIYKKKTMLHAHSNSLSPWEVMENISIKKQWLSTTLFFLVTFQGWFTQIRWSLQCEGFLNRFLLLKWCDAKAAEYGTAETHAGKRPGEIFLRSWGQSSFPPREVLTVQGAVWVEHTQVLAGAY